MRGQKRSNKEIRACYVEKIENAVEAGKPGAGARILAELHSAEIDPNYKEPTLRSSEELDAIIKSHCLDRPDGDRWELTHPLTNEDPDGAIITAADVAAVIRRSRDSSAHGRDGWQNHLIKLIGAGSRHSPEFCELMAALCNRFTSGTISPGIVSMFNELRLVVIDKKNKIDYRVLGISGGLSRIVEKAVIVGSVQKTIGKKLMPHQWGIGVSGGIDCLVRETQLRHELMQTAGNEDQAIMAADVANAFPSVHQTAVLAAVREYTPELLRYYKTGHAEPSRVFNSKGILLGSTDCGEIQGKPLSSLFFSLACLNITRDVETAIVGECARLGVQAPQSPLLPSTPPPSHMPPNPTIPVARVAAFIDDLTLLLPLVVVLFAFNKLSQEMAKIGLKLSAPKTHILSRAGTDVTNIVEQIGCTHSSEGVVILGSPIGDIEYRMEHAKRVANKSIDLLDTLSSSNNDLKPQTRFTLLVQCIIPKTTHLFRTLDHPDPRVEELKLSVDNAVISALIRIIGEDPQTTDRQYIFDIAFLPAHMGGLGLQQQGGVNGQKSLLQSRELTEILWARPTISKPSLAHLVFLAPAICADIPWAYTTDEDHETSIRLAGSYISADDADPCWIRRRARDMKRIGRTKLLSRIRQGLTAAGDSRTLQSERLANILSCSYRGSTRRFHVYGSIHGSGLTDSQFADNIRLHLGFAPIYWVPRFSFCHCRSTPVDNCQHYEHCLDCRYTAGNSVTPRHDACLKHLVELLQSIPYGTANTRGFSIQMAPHLDTADGKYILGDLAFSGSDGKVRIVDFGITHPGARYNERRHHTSEIPDAAAQAYETQKFEHYKQVPNLVESRRFTPFIIESTGRLGPSARAFLDEWTKGQSYIKNRFLNRIAVTLARYNGIFMDAARKRFGQVWMQEHEEGEGFVQFAD